MAILNGYHLSTSVREKWPCIFLENGRRTPGNWQKQPSGACVWWLYCIIFMYDNKTQIFGVVLG